MEGASDEFEEYVAPGAGLEGQSLEFAEKQCLRERCRAKRGDVQSMEGEFAEQGKVVQRKGRREEGVGRLWDLFQEIIPLLAVSVYEVLLLS